MNQLYDNTKKKWRKIMGFTWCKDLDCYEEGREKKKFGQSKDLDCYEERRKKKRFGRSKDLNYY